VLVPLLQTHYFFSFKKEKERETISENVIDAMCEAGEKKEESVEQQQTEHQVVEQVVEPVVVPVAEAVVKPAVVEPVESVDDVVAPKPVEGEGEGEVEGEEDEEDDEEVDEEVEDVEAEAENEDISNLQRSWEMFELAKVVYQKQTTDVVSFKKRIAECLLKLGEISIEQELYEQAIVDITESIRLQEEEQVAARDERLLAETYYQLGLAQQFNNQFKFALDSYQRSINILQLRIDKLKQEWNTTDNKQPVQDEITELEAILPEILGKIDECNEQDQQTVNLVKECFINKFNGSANGVANGDSAEVKDITSLVKSKVGRVEFSF
jgi:tetratricopeptide (TPR) repeat protein